MNSNKQYDAIIIGAGLGGLLSAAQLLQRGKRVVLVERLPHCGGRFTAKMFQGVQVSTGAVHMVPFGSSGVLAAMLRRLRVPYRFFDADVFGSFHVHGKQYRAPGILGVFKFLGPRQFFWFTRIGYLMFFRPLPPQEGALPFDAWLRCHIDVERNPQLVAFFERISRFALSLELHQVSAAEVIRTTKNMFRFGAPAIVQGGCGELTGELVRHILDRGGEIRLSCEVLQILHEGERVTGVQVRDKASGEEAFLAAPLLVSDIGPRATRGLLLHHRVTQAEVLKKHRPGSAGVAVAAAERSLPDSVKKENEGEPQTPLTTPGVSEENEDLIGGGEVWDDQAQREAVGLKVHVLSDVSLIPHKGIMYCLDTQRIAGIVQPTNSDPSLAPAGKHLLISHQVIQSNNVEEERALALADLRMLFGEAFEKHCRVLTMGTYRGEWPVNRLVQGEDVTASTPLQGLYLVGDAVKPPGYLMVEGVAQSVNAFLDLLDESDNGRDGTSDHMQKTARQRPKHIITPPSRLNALRWLWRAPGNAGRS